MNAAASACPTLIAPRLIELPPVPEPARLTARWTGHTLHDHLQTFLSVNNPHGFVPDLPPADSAVMALLLAEVKRDSISLESFKRTAWTIKKAGAGQIKHGNALELLAAVYGYRTYASLRAALVDDHVRRKHQ